MPVGADGPNRYQTRHGCYQTLRWVSGVRKPGDYGTNHIRGDKMRFVMLEITDERLSDAEAVRFVDNVLSEYHFGIQLSDHGDHLLEVLYRTTGADLQTPENPVIIRRWRRGR